VSRQFGDQSRLAALLREITGIDEVVPEDRPGISASVMVRIDVKEIVSKSTERLSLQWQPEGLALCTWPAELKGQAEATFRTGRAQRILDFADRRPPGWRAWPNVHLAYRFASIRERAYLTCGLNLAEYVHGWLGGDFARVGGHHRDQVHPVLWPWLLERGYASPQDERLLDDFLSHLGRRDAHLRPSIGLQRTWTRAEAADLDQRGALTGELRAAITEILGVLDEPLPPACAAQRPQ
jgi:hypothetical protein